MTNTDFFIDIEECQLAVNPCGNTAVCQNIPGSYVCVCPAGRDWNQGTTKCDGTVLMYM